jgi:RimJ/RimL family protein N-acetyltransferase
VKRSTLPSTTDRSSGTKRWTSGYRPFRRAHVGQMGTFLRAEWRGRGIGKALFAATCQFARANGYGKFVIQVRSSNLGAQSFYKRMGFCECGRLGRQVRIDGQEDDEVLFELFL